MRRAVSLPPREACPAWRRPFALAPHVSGVSVRLAATASDRFYPPSSLPGLAASALELPLARRFPFATLAQAQVLCRPAVGSLE